MYEQALLKRAMESAALFHEQQPETEDKILRRKYLGKLCSLEGFLGKLPSGDLKNYPTDDYFVCLMRQFPECKYVKEWFSRGYRLKPVWKSRERFWLYFRKFNFAELTPECWLFSESCRQYIAEHFNIDLNDVWIEDATPKTNWRRWPGLKSTSTAS